MSHTRTHIRTEVGEMYGINVGTQVERHPLRLGTDGARTIGSLLALLRGDELVTVIANEQDDETLEWSLCLFNESSSPLYGWIHNDDLRWVM